MPSALLTRTLGDTAEEKRSSILFLRLTQRATLVGLITRTEQLPLLREAEKKTAILADDRFFSGCGGGT